MPRTSPAWWINSSDNLGEFDEHNYQVDAPEGHDANLKVPAAGYEDNQKCKHYNVLWVQRGDEDVA